MSTIGGLRVAPEPAHEATVRELAEMAKMRAVERLWERDAGMWAADDAGRRIVASSLGWLDVAERMDPEVPALLRFAAEAKHEGVERVLVLGMGGSSLAPLVFASVFGSAPGFPALEVLDSTDPAAVAAAGERASAAATLYIVASKSGGTLEPNVLFEHFFAAAQRELGDGAAGRFIAVTDPGSPLERLARDRRLRKVFHGDPTIGGRFSALSAFGLVPLALAGGDVVGFLSRARAMMRACAAEVPAAENPGAALGAFMSACSGQGRDKLTLLVPPALAALPAWIEQLVAESSGKGGRGILPVAGEPVAVPAHYANDRAFVLLRVAGSEEPGLEEAAAAIAAAGHPVATIDVADSLELGAEMYRWEIATALACARLGVNAFDQPNVQEAKDGTNEVLAGVAPGGAGERVVAERGGVRLYADAATHARLGGGDDFAALLAAHAASAVDGDYFAVNAFVAPAPALEEALERPRRRLRDARRVATTLGFGPRFLHSTGQYHKGGPNTGVFLQLTWTPPVDENIPGSPYGFARVLEAQAAGDLAALRARGRRVLRADLGADVAAGIATLDEALAALAG